MTESEFDIIRRYFTRHQSLRDDVIVGIGDDGAVLRVPEGEDLVVSTDTLIAGIHFPEDTAPAAIGHKALAVNLSDLAAMGATPAWITLSLSLPAADPVWLEAFASAFFALANRYRAQLVGGDTCRGPLSVTVQVHGLVPAGRALRRQGARPGDSIYVTGTPGDAALALALVQAGKRNAAGCAELFERLEFPLPRIEAGLALRDCASAVIDISDGLLADLGHVLASSGTGATLQADKLPRSAAFIRCLEMAGAAKERGYYALPLAGGDDYELCFTVAPEKSALAEERLAGLPGGCTAIGVVEAATGLRCLREDGSACPVARSGYQHFGGGPGNG